MSINNFYKNPKGCLTIFLKILGSQKRKDDVKFVNYAKKIIKLKQCTTKTEDSYISFVEKYFTKYFGSKNIDEIKRSDIITLHSDIGKNYKRTANQVLSLLYSIFNAAIEDELIIKNPCKNIKKFKESPRNRFLCKEELIRLLFVINQLPVNFKNFFLLLLYTDARCGNVKSMKWEDMDFKAKKWTIHEHESKNRKEMTVYLSKEACICLNEMKAISKNSPFVFPAKKSKSGHMEEPKKRWAQVCKDAGIENCHIHDLRATFATWQQKGGSSQRVIGLALGHSAGSRATAGYMRDDISDEVKASVEKVSKRFASLKPKRK